MRELAINTSNFRGILKLKKIISALLACIVLFALAGCKSAEEKALEDATLRFNSAVNSAQNVQVNLSQKITEAEQLLSNTKNGDLTDSSLLDLLRGEIFAAKAANIDIPSIASYTEQIDNQIRELDAQRNDFQTVINSMNEAIAAVSENKRELANRIAAMSVSVDVAKKNGGFYIMQEGKLIDIGKQQRDKSLIHCPTAGDWYHYSAYSLIARNEIDIPQLSDNDKIIAYSQQGIPTMQFYGIIYNAYTIGIAQTTVLSSKAFMDIEGDWAEYARVSSTGVPAESLYPFELSLNSNSFKDQMRYGFVPLPKGEAVTLSWYKGTEYQERVKTADYQYYGYDGKNLQKIQGVLTKDGYAEYDLSAVPNGLYWIQGHGIVKIERDSYSPILTTLGYMSATDGISVENGKTFNAYDGTVCTNYIIGREAGSISYNLDKKYSRLKGLLAILKAGQKSPGEILKIYADDSLIYTSPVVEYKDAPVSIDIDISNCNTLTLVFENGNYGAFADGQLFP